MSSRCEEAYHQSSINHHLLTNHHHHRTIHQRPVTASCIIVFHLNHYSVVHNNISQIFIMNTTSMETRSDLESSVDNDNDIETDNLSEKPASSGSPLHLPPRPIELAGENTPSYLEEYDEFGEVVMVGDLCFTEKILGSGSYGEVVLAKRILSADDSSADDFTLRGSFNEITTNSVTSMQSTSSDTSKAEVSQQSKNDYVAVKIYSKSLLKRMRNIKRSKSKGTIVVHTALDDVEMEIALMKQMRHPNLVSLLQVIDSVDSDALYVVLEFVPLGEIMTFDPDLIRYSHRHAHTPGLTKDGFFTEDFASLFFVDVLHGLGEHCVCASNHFYEIIINNLYLHYRYLAVF